MIRYFYLRASSLLADHAFVILVVFHIAGLLGLLSPFSAFFGKFTPLTLVLSGYLLWLHHRSHTVEFYAFALFTFAFGFFIEYVGVRYGILFGSYQYGQTLGLKVAGVPVIIGLNWLLIIYSVAVLTEYLAVPAALKIVVGSALAVALDWLIEPVAMRFDFWDWRNHVVPLQNYLGWFFTAAIMLTAYQALKVKAENRIALPYYAIQVVFFLSIQAATRLL
jgi:putative membrane protein